MASEFATKGRLIVVLVIVFIVGAVVAVNWSTPPPSTDAPAHVTMPSPTTPAPPEDSEPDIKSTYQVALAQATQLHGLSDQVHEAARELENARTCGVLCQVPAFNKCDALTKQYDQSEVQLLATLRTIQTQLSTMKAIYRNHGTDVEPVIAVEEQINGISADTATELAFVKRLEAKVARLRADNPVIDQVTPLTQPERK